MRPAWYVHRLRQMSAAEVAWRARTRWLQERWRSQYGDHWPTPPALPEPCAIRPSVVAAESTIDVRALAEAADAIMAGRWPVLGVVADVGGTEPDWFQDPRTGRIAQSDAYCFDVPYRSEALVGNVKCLWELSRHHHLTTLAAAYRYTGDLRYAERAVAQLASWWHRNPPLCGVHWVSGIEIGLRLIAWVWIRRLLGALPAIEDTFERNPVFLRQLHAHQSWIATFRSRFSSANNHLIAEAAGLMISALAFPAFPASAGWAATAAAWLETSAAQQTFPDGLNRELASEYHVFALELFLVATAEADAQGARLSDDFCRIVRAMTDALAATVDVAFGMARQGDGDDGRALVLDGPDGSAVAVVLGAGGRLFGPAPWWPAISAATVGYGVLAPLLRDRTSLPGHRPPARPNGFPYAGVAILRDIAPDPREIWCRFDHGPHGFLSTAAHAHADALSFELREGGLEILVDPGTYCYHGEADWRDYFRATRAHNTLEIDGRDQGAHAGPFLWLTHPAGRLTAARGLDSGAVAEIEATQDGYAPTTHHRRLTLDRTMRTVAVRDWIEAPAAVRVRLALHLHPRVACTLDGAAAMLRWRAGNEQRSAVLALPPGLGWRLHQGDMQPIAGWYSAGFGHKEPSVTLWGTGQLAPDTTLETCISFADDRTRRHPDGALPEAALSP